MKKIENIIVHCSDSAWGCAREIRRWHLQKGWKDLGYHFVILNGWILKTLPIPCLNGSIEAGRELDGDPFIEDNEIGAHTLGYNDKSIGICGIALHQWTENQKLSLVHLVKDLMIRFLIPIENVLGHCETASGKEQGKTCPNLDMDLMREWIAGEK